VTTLFALVSPILLGFAGLGVDAAYWYQSKTSLQIGNDITAISLARDYMANGPTDALSPTFGKWILAKQNIKIGDISSFQINMPPKGGSQAGNNSAIEVISEIKAQRFLSKLFVSSDPGLRARSVVVFGGPTACIIALSNSASNAFSFKGGSNLDFDCGAASNSSAANAFSMTSSTWAHFASLRVVGGMSVAGTLVLDNTPAITNSSPTSNPFTNWKTPNFTKSCDYNKFSPRRGSTLNPGVYCGGLSFGSGSFYMEPGTYIIDQGDFSVSAQAVITGDGVTIFMTDSSRTKSSDKTGTFVMSGGATVNLSAPLSGSNALMLFVVDPLSSVSGAHVIGSASGEMMGNIYIKKGSLSLAGNTNFKFGCVTIVAELIQFSGKFSGKGTCPYSSSSTTGNMAKSQVILTE
jgi:hypothetical protein